jgi:DNA-binding MarR family transcriptional regulator
VPARSQHALAGDPGTGVCDERRTSPGLLLALLGQYAMRRLRDAHTGLELTPRQFQLLGVVHDDGPVGQRELGHTLEIDPSILVTLLNPLEADALLSRQRDPLDRRRHLVSLTEKGEERLAAAAQAQRDAEDELFAGLDQTQRGQLRDLLVALKESLSGECAAAAEAEHAGCPAGADEDAC